MCLRLLHHSAFFPRNEITLAHRYNLPMHLQLSVLKLFLAQSFLCVCFANAQESFVKWKKNIATWYLFTYHACR